jgi:hypothetical protein
LHKARLGELDLWPVFNQRIVVASEAAAVALELPFNRLADRSA